MQAVICTHHWLILTPQGPTSLGRCLKCGVEHSFRNSVWEENYLKRSKQAHIKYCTKERV